MSGRNGGPNSFTPSQQKEAQRLEQQMKQYEGKSENELMQELFRSIEAGRQDGSFTPEAMQQFVNNVSPMLDGQQRKKLQEIIKKIQ